MVVREEKGEPLPSQEEEEEEEEAAERVLLLAVRAHRQRMGRK